MEAETAYRTFVAAITRRLASSSPSITRQKGAVCRVCDATKLKK
jgi:hypothetical protein